MRGFLGTFNVPFEIKNLNGGEFVGVEALVDTGSSYTVLGEDLLGLLGIRPTERQQFQLGDNSFVEYEMGEARLRLNGSEMTTLVVFGPAGVSPLLGATTLQLFRLAADSVNERLIPMPPIRARPF